MNYTFYICSIINYSEKAVLTVFGFTNKNNQDKTSSPVFIPKQFIKSIDFGKRTITIDGWWYSKNGYIWRYRTDKAFSKPQLEIERSDILSFFPDFSNYYSLGNIQTKGIICAYCKSEIFKHEFGNFCCSNLDCANIFYIQFTEIKYKDERYQLQFNEDPII